MYPGTPKPRTQTVYVPSTSPHILAIRSHKHVKPVLLYNQENYMQTKTLFLSLRLTAFWILSCSVAFRLFFTAQRFSFLSFPTWGLNIDHSSLGAGMHKKKISNLTLHVWMYKTTLKICLEIKKTIKASKPEILPYMLQIELLNVKASSVKFVGSRNTKLPFQILQVKSANRAQGDGAFQTSHTSS